MSTLSMLVGLPCSGKSTWVENNEGWDDIVLSTDNFIEIEALKSGKTYNDVFKESIGPATASIQYNLEFAIKKDKDIIWDQTNLTVKSRKSKLDKIPNHYTKVAIYFDTPIDLIMDRNSKRPGKFIPLHIMESMIKSIQVPTVDEGFHSVVVIK